MWDGLLWEAWAEGGGELNLITIFVPSEAAAVRQQIVLFPEANGEPPTSRVHRAVRCISSELPRKFKVSGESSFS